MEFDRDKKGPSGIRVEGTDEQEPRRRGVSHGMAESQRHRSCCVRGSREARGAP